MTAAPHTTPCTPCSGSGLVPRPKRRLPNGELDPFDTVEWQKITCEPCGGSGLVPLNLNTIAEKPAARPGQTL